MPHPLTNDQHRLLYHLLFETELSITGIHRFTGIARSCIYNKRLSWELFGTPNPPPSVLRGRPARLNNEQVDRLLEYLDGQPSAYLDEMAWFLFDEYDVAVGPTVIWRSLRERKWSRKVTKQRARAQDPELRALWQARRLGWRVDRICCVDESASNERTGDRKYGWSPQGMPARDVHNLRRGCRWSILPAMTINGWLKNPLIIQGSVTGDIFLDWLEREVLPQLEPGWILIMDNASIHRNEQVRLLCQRFLVTLEELPPYSPDYNPIEHAFHILKMWIRRNQPEQHLFSSFGTFLEYAVEQVGGIHAWEHFRRSGYMME